MLRFLKVVFLLVVVVAAAVLGYAYIGDLSPTREEVRQPVSLGDGG